MIASGFVSWGITLDGDGINGYSKTGMMALKSVFQRALSFTLCSEIFPSII